MPKTVLFEQNEWARILYALNPDGNLPSAGPATTVAVFAERALAQARAMEPAKIEAGDLMSHQQFSEVVGWVDELEPAAEVLHGRGVINLTPTQRARLESSGLIERLERVAGTTFCKEFEALVLFYASEGFLPLHVDDQAEYQFNALINVRRIRPELGSGTGTLFWLEQGPCWIDLDPGEAVIFDAHHTVHGRLPLSLGDEVVLLSIGFTPVDVNDDKYVPRPPRKE